MRGNPHVIDRDRHAQRSIPACAGEPMSDLFHKGIPEVYPRVCGGTGYDVDDLDDDIGLSPRVRGNRRPGHVGGAYLGSIPACAGEPSARHALDALNLVYPRVCGGTGCVGVLDDIGDGLSPRVRGNRAVKGQYVAGVGSIPACAGEPKLCLKRPLLPTVYPRVCGGTRGAGLPDYRVRGLSPRVRGNP